MKLRKITDVLIRKLSPKNKAYDEPLGNALYVTVRPNGRKIFFLRYTVDGRRTKHKLGEYPFYSLAQAMLDAQNQKQEAQTVGNLHIAKQEKQKQEAQVLEQNRKSNFQVLVSEYIEQMEISKKWGDKTARAQGFHIKNYLLPCFAQKSINDISISDVRNCFKKMSDCPEVGAKMARVLFNIFEYADTLGILEERNNIMLSRIKRLSKDMPKAPEKSRYQALSNKEIGELMQNIQSVKNCSQTVKTALNLAPFLALRPYELCSLEWSDIDFENEQILIPADKMKMKREHLVPMSKQALDLILELKRHTDSKKYVFESYSSQSGHIAPESVRKVLRKLGYTSATEEKKNFTTHSFRGLFSTIAHQSLKANSDIVEFQLAHVEGNKVKATYNQTNTYSYLEERKNLMQTYADYLESLT